MNRRNFLQTMLAACAAPAIVKAENIMRINPDILLPPGPTVGFIDEPVQFYVGTGKLYIGDQSLGDVYGMTINCNGSSIEEVYEQVVKYTRSLDA